MFEVYWLQKSSLAFRWAMAAAAGILGQELLGVEPRWFDAGSKEYIFPVTTLTAIEFLTLGALELKRYQGWKKNKTVRLPCVVNH